MKRRKFGLLAGSGLAATMVFHMARGQRPNPSLLGTSLTPMGAERAGNADGSIPAWTGGLTAPPLPPDQPVDVKLFANERPLRTVDAGNMAKHAALLTPGTQAMMRKFGFRIEQYETHRTAAAPQYVYDNTAKNMAAAQLGPQGGQLGFTGAYGGVPFPIIDTANPLAGGAQLIWNHLTTWEGFSRITKFFPTFVVAGRRLTLSSASLNRFEYPFYDPNGTLESFDGYYSKAHLYYLTPPQLVGSELIVWHSTDLSANPDITWGQWNGNGRIRKVRPDDAYAALDAAASQIASFDENFCFYGSPAQYDWRYIGKQEMLVPYNCNEMHFCAAPVLFGPNYPNPAIVRWEKHRVWVVEATLCPGESNALARRRLYIDEDSWCALLGEGFDASGEMIKYYTVYNRCIPSMPGTCKLGSLVFDLRSGDYVYAGSVRYESYSADEFIAPQPLDDFAPEMTAGTIAF